MTNRVIKGKAFWEFDGSGQKHLYFVLSEPDIDDKVLIVNITDANNSPWERIIYKVSKNIKYRDKS